MRIAYVVMRIASLRAVRYPKGGLAMTESRHKGAEGQRHKEAQEHKSKGVLSFPLGIN
jgi:hypothetical protein